jgi:hypothetical protein
MPSLSLHVNSPRAQARGEHVEFFAVRRDAQHAAVVRGDRVPVFRAEQRTALREIKIPGGISLQIQRELVEVRRHRHVVF